jgi:hypothetical protein
LVETLDRAACAVLAVIDDLTDPAHHLLVSRVVFIGTLALILIAPSLTRASILAWRDTDGVTHYVDNLDSVPSEYRGSVVTFVKDWVRPPAPTESVSPAPEPDPPAAPTVQIIETGGTSFERGFWAGRLSAMTAQRAPVDAPIPSIVQSVQIFPTAPELATAFPFFGTAFAFPARLHPRRVFAPRFRSRFFHRPGGLFLFGKSRPSSGVFFRH